MRQLMGALKGPEDLRLLQELRRRLIIFFGLQRQFLRNERNLEDLRAELTNVEREQLESVNHRPLAYLSSLSRFFEDLRSKGVIESELCRNIDMNLGNLVDSLGGAERILRTPVPFAYAQHIKGFLFVFCFSLPFVLAEPTGHWNPLASAAVAYALFGIEEIGVEIEDPFGDDPNDLPVDLMEEGLVKVCDDLLFAFEKTIFDKPS